MPDSCYFYLTRCTPFCLVILALFLPGCTPEPTEEQLSLWRQDAIARNAAIVTQQAQDRKQTQWEFTITGQTTKGSQTFNWSELEALATTTINTTSPHNTTDPNALLNFRGIAVSQLLDAQGVKPNVTSVTFLGFDGFRATVSLADLKRYPILLALERDGRPISRSEGGPLLLVFPQSEYQQLAQYAQRFWVFYVTHAIVGTEPVHIRIGSHNLDRNAFEQLPQITLEETVGYRQDWPIGKVKLRGVRVKDVLEAAHVNLNDYKNVIVKGKAATTRDRSNPIRLRMDDIRECNIVLVTQWGDSEQPIPARLGGPVTLASSSSCYGSGGFENATDEDHRWVTFVEELEPEGELPAQK